MPDQEKMRKTKNTSIVRNRQGYGESMRARLHIGETEKWPALAFVKVSSALHASR